MGQFPDPEQLRKTMLTVREVAARHVAHDALWPNPEFPGYVTPAPDGQRPPLLTRALASGATNAPGRSAVHGEPHWKSVALNGLDLAEQTPGSDATFVLLFAILHDLMRESDGSDPEHGSRSAALYGSLVSQGAVELRPELHEAMAFALSNHNTLDHPPSDSNVNVGICWDADRLDLWRVGLRPNPELLATDAARDDRTRERSIERFYAAKLGTHPTWLDIAEQVRQGSRNKRSATIADHPSLREVSRP